MNFFCKVKSLKFLLAVPILLTGCQCSNRESVDEVSETLLTEDANAKPDSIITEVMLKQEAENVKERVEGIFNIVKSDYMKSGGVVQNELLDRYYCSESWNRLLLAVRCKEEETNTMFFDIDYWGMVREPGMVTFDEFVVTDLTLGSEKRATVAYTVYGATTYTPAMIELVFERGQWVIDNFHNLKYMVNVKESMERFLTASLT